eukprot:3939647-Rhodomonas_salina.2
MEGGSRTEKTEGQRGGCDRGTVTHWKHTGRQDPRGTPHQASRSWPQAARARSSFIAFKAEEATPPSPSTTIAPSTPLPSARHRSAKAVERQEGSGKSVRGRELQAGASKHAALRRESTKSHQRVAPFEMQSRILQTAAAGLVC